MRIDMEKVEAAAKSLRAKANELLKIENKEKKAPMLLMKENEDSKAVVESWFQNIDNIKEVEAKAGSSTNDLRSRLYQANPMLYLNRLQPGSVKNTCPEKQVVLIALEDLNQDNGLSKWESAPTAIKQEDWVQFSDDMKHDFLGNNGGGLSIIIAFHK
ncbi:MAG: hypothetical protein MMC33_007821 [Icmadophila ericetorum]|nr:hypothetical protein [Icmadophila ericetorum]